MSRGVEFSCPHCGGSVGVGDFLESVRSYAALTDSGTALCPRCAKAIEFRVGAGELVLGYTYWGGSLHFDGVETVPVPELRQTRSGDTVVLRYGGKTLWASDGAAGETT